MTKQTRTTTHDAVKLRAQADRGRRADALLNDPLMVEAFDIVLKRIEKRWQDSSIEDRQLRDDAYALFQAVKLLQGSLKAIMVSGNNAKVLLTLEEIKGGGGT